MTISSKITIIYTVLFSIVLILISCFIIGNAWIYYNSVSKSEITEVADKVENYILSGGEINKENISALVDNKYIEVKVTTLDEEFNIGTMERPDMYPTNENPPDIMPDRGNNKFGYRQIMEEEYMYAHRRVDYNDKVYIVDVFRLFNHEQSVINLFLIIFLVGNAIAILLAFLISKYISKKILKPIRDITATANNISINDLEQRMEVPQADDEIRTLIVTFNDMISRLDKSFANQKQFISDASHELKTPISVIDGYVNLIDRWGKDDEAVLKESIDSIKAETEHMSKLVQQLLFLARTDNNTTNIASEKFSLNEVASEVLKDIGVLDVNAETKLIENGDISIVGDEHLIKQLIWIFCENAIKYSRENPKITIEVGRNKDGAYVSVADNGIGISKEDIPHIFDRFFRADKSRNKTIDGNGLGLSIAHWIIKSHNAEVKVDSEENKGTKFTVVFK